MVDTDCIKTYENGAVHHAVDVTAPVTTGKCSLPALKAPEIQIYASDTHFKVRLLLRTCTQKRGAWHGHSQPSICKYARKSIIKSIVSVYFVVLC